MYLLKFSIQQIFIQWSYKIPELTYIFFYNAAALFFFYFVFCCYFLLVFNFYSLIALVACEYDAKICCSICFVSFYTNDDKVSERESEQSKKKMLKRSDSQSYSNGRLLVPPNILTKHKFIRFYFVVAADDDDDFFFFLNVPTSRFVWNTLVCTWMFKYKPTYT